jgi:SAM-dependent methyltransferase
LKPLSAIMENVTAYRLWQAPFAEKKLMPLLRRPDLAAARRVLDVGCGPGTNVRHFEAANYLGIDLNPGYVSYARRRFGREFVAADVRTYAPPSGQRFDFILVNSLLHHIDDAGTHQILASLGSLLTDDGHVHILDLILPKGRGLARLLASADRGNHPRELETWKAIFGEYFDPVVVEPYPLGAFGLTLWNMLYFKGRRRR